MSRPYRGRSGRDPADLVVGALFLALPLVASPRLWDQFTTVKWYALEALAALWLAVECFQAGRGSAWAARARAPLLALAGLGAFNLARGGWAWALTPLVERASVVCLAWCAFRYLRRRPRPLQWPARGAAAGALITCALGTAQVMGWRMPLFTAGDGRSALFGNVNMAAQFLGWAFLLLVVARPRGRPARALVELLLGWIGAELYFLSCRSVFLGLGLALACLLLARRLSPWAVLRLVAGAGLLVVVLLRSGAASGNLDEARRHKDLAVSQRLDLWRATLALAADHPLGVGPSGFVHAFPPYHLASRLARDESIEYRHPHNELLRVLAEEGWAFTALALGAGAWLVVSLFRRRGRLWARSARGALVVASGVYLAAEAAFQFPLGVAFGALAFAWWVALALDALEPGGQPLAARRRRPLAAAAIAVLAAGIAGGMARTAWSEYLFVNRASDDAAQQAACRLDPRNLAACVNAAWLEDAAEAHEAARARLRAVLARSPHYGPALKLLGEIALSVGDREAGCFDLWLYDALYRGSSAVHAPMVESCPAEWLAAYPREQPMPYYGALPPRAR